MRQHSLRTRLQGASKLVDIIKTNDGEASDCYFLFCPLTLGHPVYDRYTFQGINTAFIMIIPLTLGHPVDHSMNSSD